MRRRRAEVTGRGRDEAAGEPPPLGGEACIPAASPDTGDRFVWWPCRTMPGEENRCWEGRRNRDVLFIGRGVPGRVWARKAGFGPSFHGTRVPRLPRPYQAATSTRRLFDDADLCIGQVAQLVDLAADLVVGGVDLARMRVLLRAVLAAERLRLRCV